MTHLPRLGILGGGQLARMMIQAAIPLGIDVAILADAADSPAGRLTRHEIVGAATDEEALRAFADLVDVVTLENEFVPADALERLAAWGKIVQPGANVLGVIQDKLTQKQTLAQAGLPVPRFAAVESPATIRQNAKEFGWPLVLKARRNGYDGYGNATLRNVSEVGPALIKLGWPKQQLMVEQMVPFVRELAVLVVRDEGGRSVTYPVVETVQQNHICHLVRAPAPVEPEIVERAVQLANDAVAAVNSVGVTAVELFQTENGELLVNELAPRPHNSGHFSINACYTSQFENHLRAVLGLPLSDADLYVPAAVMVNLLGTRDDQTATPDLSTPLQEADVYVHLYGKRQVRTGRKMGHVTAVGGDVAEAEARALQAAQTIHL